MTLRAGIKLRGAGFGLLLLALGGCAGTENPAEPEAAGAEAATLESPTAESVTTESAATESASVESVEPAEVSEPPVEAAPRIYNLGESEFRFTTGTLLQTWPVMAMDEPRRFARLAVQIPAEVLEPTFAGIPDPIQIDIVQPQFIPDPDGVLTGAFADWKGREQAPVQSTYKFTITSNRAATGERLSYLRLDHNKIGLSSLSPFKQQAGAPIYLFALDDTHVTTLIECGPLPLGYEGADHCSLRRQLDDDFGYRVLFPQDLLPFWQLIDNAARDYVNASRL